jgi:hypothetical protein
MQNLPLQLGRFSTDASLDSAFQDERTGSKSFLVIQTIRAVIAADAPQIRQDIPE